MMMMMTMMVIVNCDGEEGGYEDGICGGSIGLITCSQGSRDKRHATRKNVGDPRPLI